MPYSNTSWGNEIMTNAVVEPIALRRCPKPGALVSLFVLTLRQYLHGRRLLVLSLLFALPSVLAAVLILFSRFPPTVEGLQFAFAFNLIPHALAPLAALLYATGIIQDEVEEQTLTYLMLRPLPRWLLFLIKLLATLLMISAVTAVFTTAIFLVINLAAGQPLTASLFNQIVKTTAALVLAEAGYCGLFGFMGLLMRRSLLVGVAYIFLFEGILASLDTVARRMTIMYYFRVLILRWLQPASGKEWSIDLTTAPTVSTCVLTLIGIGLVLSVLAALFFAGREFRMKTPEGN
jgi:ABC-2 type transport system permease protein